jgi:hypothetical protein
MHSVFYGKSGVTRRLLQHHQQRARRAHHHRRRRHVPRRECRSAAAEVLGLVGCRRRGASSSSPAGAGGVVGVEDFGWGGCVRFCCYVGERGGSGADRRLGGEEVLCEGRGEGERDRVWGGLYMSVVSIFDRQIVRLTATSS